LEASEGGVQCHTPVARLKDVGMNDCPAIQIAGIARWDEGIIGVAAILVVVAKDGGIAEPALTPSEAIWDADAEIGPQSSITEGNRAIQGLQLRRLGGRKACVRFTLVVSAAGMYSLIS